MEQMEENLLFCKLLPKLELHAHLNGSLSERTLDELHNLHMSSQKNVANNLCRSKMTICGEKGNLEECFELFKYAHAMTSTPASLSLATSNVIQEFADDGVIYLELRSTPRSVPDVMTKQEYIDAIVNAIKKKTAECSTIVKLLISLNRSHDKADAADVVKLTMSAKETHPDIVVGIDLSGAPMHGDLISDYLPILKQAQDKGLKLTVHCAEIPNPTETEEILKMMPDRLGHCTCIHELNGGSLNLWKMLLESKIPVELCLTSNVKTKTVESYEKHHFKYFFEAKHPIAICTDDKGVFGSTLSEEYSHLQVFNLSKLEMFNLSMSTTDYTFASNEEKEYLKNKLTSWKLLNEQYFV